MVERLDNKYADIGVYTMDVDFDRVYLREEFGVVSPATTILVVDGEIVQRWFGPIDEGEVSHELDVLLNQGYSGDSIPFPTPIPEPSGVQT